MRKLWLVVVLVAACGGKKDSSPEGKKENPTTADAAAKTAPTGVDGGAKVAAAKDGGTAAVKRAPMVTRAQIDALLAAWLTAQNDGKFDAYEQLYADDFKGVRRSGKQTKRLDRKGWLKERKNMFKNPMLVAMQDVEVTLGQGRASVRFTQEWSSGKYHDVGPKVIEAIAADGSALKISREELLVSRIVKPAKPLDPDETLPVYPMIGDRVVISSDVDAAWAKGDPKLLSGSLPERDPSCDDDPPDYEEDNNRYFECEATDPDSGHDEFVATQGVDLGALPRFLSAWVGQKVRVTGPGGAGCEATVDRLELYAEAEATYGEVTGAGDDDEDIAGEVLEGEAVLTATLIGGCKGTWAQPASAAAVAPWKREQAPPAVEKAVLAHFKDGGMDQYDLDGVEIDVVISPDGKTRLAVADREREECFGISPFFAILSLKGDKVGDVVFDDADRALDAALDTDGDGWPELIFDDGIATWDAEGETYDHRSMIDFPDTVMEECGE